MSKLIKLKVPCLNLPKSKRKVLIKIAEVQGVDEISVDVNSGIVTVRGNANADPVTITVGVRKIDKSAELLSLDTNAGASSPLAQELNSPLTDVLTTPSPFNPGTPAATATSKVIRLKVDLFSQKSKTKVLLAAAKVEGVNHISVEGEGESGLLTVRGNADPVQVAINVRKINKLAQLLSIETSYRDEPFDDSALIYCDPQEQKNFTHFYQHSPLVVTSSAPPLPW